jgi:spectinomycin phosphotransferase
MLEKPDFPDEKISACLLAEYGLFVTQIGFLPLGADQNTAVYRAVAADGRTYFVKLRSGLFDETAVTVPKFLSDQGIRQIIAPIATQSNQLWARLDPFAVILYPFIAGHNGFEVPLSDHHWHDLGVALKQIHTVAVPPMLLQQIQQESYTPRWREIVKRFLTHVVDETLVDSVAIRVAALLQSKRTEILDLVQRAERLAQMLTVRSPNFVLCHSDIHAANMLIDTNNVLHIVDWDNPILAPKERDLMFVGGGLGGDGHTPQEEERLFYGGYGETPIDANALAYYRYERIVQDIAVYCEQLLLSNEGGADREQSLHYLASNFLPDGLITLAYESDKSDMVYDML